MSQPGWLEFGVPTLDRPFGLALWPIFERIFGSVMGYKPQDFRFKQGETTFSTFTVTATVLISYYIVVFGGREVMRNRKPLQLNWLFKVHNLYLTLISGSLLVLFAEQLIPTVYRNGVFFAICNREGGWTDKLVILYYVCYFTPHVGRNCLNWRLTGCPAQLPHQVPRTSRYLLPLPQEEAVE